MKTQIILKYNRNYAHRVRVILVPPLTTKEIISIVGGGRQGLEKRKIIGIRDLWPKITKTCLLNANNANHSTNNSNNVNHHKGIIKCNHSSTSNSNGDNQDNQDQWQKEDHLQHDSSNYNIKHKIICSHDPKLNLLQMYEMCKRLSMLTSRNFWTSKIMIMILARHSNNIVAWSAEIFSLVRETLLSTQKESTMPKITQETLAAADFCT